MYHLRSLQNSLPRILLVGSLLAAYLCTIAPGLTWANDGSDGGDLITAAATQGVAHPTGYPLYLLLARPFQFLPVGSLAFRTNLFSAIAMAMAAAMICTVVQEVSSSDTHQYGWLSGLVAGYAAGLSPLIWSQAVVTEVYGLQAFLISIIIYLYMKPIPVSAPSWSRMDRWRGFVLGIAAGNHITTLLLVPPALIIGSLYRQAQTSQSWIKTIGFDRYAFLRQLGMVGLGLSIYGILPLRASLNPPVNWGNAISLERFWWLVSAQSYRDYYLHFSWIGISSRVQALATFLLQQFGLLGVILGFTGLIVFGKISRIFVLTAWTAAVFAALAIVYESVDSYVYLIPVCLSFAIWIGLGVESAAKQATRYSLSLKIMVSLLLLAAMAGRSMTYAGRVDASKDFRAEIFAEDVLVAAPPNAIIFAEGDRAIFALWYFHFALGDRPDLAVIAVDLLHFNWYQENLRAIYPSLVVPTPFPWPESIIVANPSRSVCRVQYFDTAMIDCSHGAITP